VGHAYYARASGSFPGGRYAGNGALQNTDDEAYFVARLTASE
jgi:hypothetical protein